MFMISVYMYDWLLDYMIVIGVGLIGLFMLFFGFFIVMLVIFGMGLKGLVLILGLCWLIIIGSGVGIIWCV